MMQLPFRFQGATALTVTVFLVLALTFSPFAGAQESSRNANRYSVTVTDESPVIYDLVTTVAMDALPTALQQELLEHQNAIRVAGQPLLYRRDASAASARRTDEHYLILDLSTMVAGKLAVDAAKQQSDARAFPKDRRQARRLFQQQGLQKGGLLPWVLVDHHAALNAAFKTQQADAIAREIAAVVHFSADAAMAFHVSNNGFASAVAKEASYKTQNYADKQQDAAWWEGESLYQRCQVELLRWSRSRFEHEARVWPDRIKPFKDPIDVVFKTISQAYKLRHELSALDREICASLAINNEQDFSQRGDAYYFAMSERGGHLHRWQLENGGLLAATLITDAWQRAGRLSIGSSPSVTDQAVPTKVEKSVAKTEALVGSKSSHVFHRAGCPHAKRIARENLVPFASSQAAIKQGRRPCRTCQPK